MSPLGERKNFVRTFAGIMSAQLERYFLIGLFARGFRSKCVYIIRLYSLIYITAIRTRPRRLYGEGYRKNKKIVRWTQPPYRLVYSDFGHLTPKKGLRFQFRFSPPFRYTVTAVLVMIYTSIYIDKNDIYIYMYTWP